MTSTADRARCLLVVSVLLVGAASATGTGRKLLQAASSCNSTTFAAQLPLPLAKVHSHNDYENASPLYGALANGVCSIEVDPWLVNGTLYVAHDANQILRVNAVGKPLGTFEDMYLAPLADLYQQQGYIYPASKYTGICSSILLLVDFKGAATFNRSTGNYSASTADVGIQQFEVLEELLAEYEAEYPGLLTRFYKSGLVVPGAINAYISGSRPSPDYVANKTMRLTALDGRLTDLVNKYPPTVYPLISQGWCCGDGTVLANWTAYSRYEFAFQSVVPVPEKLTADQAAYVGGLVDTAHAQGRIIRFWATPDTVTFWNLGFDIGEDLVNTDQPKQIHDFVVGKLAGSAKPIGSEKVISASG